jgi:hypothetical protein
MVSMTFKEWIISVVYVLESWMSAPAELMLLRFIQKLKTGTGIQPSRTQQMTP